MFRNLELSSVLKRERERSGLTVRQLAEVAGLVPSTVSRLESGLIGSPKPEQLERLAEALGMDAEDLYAAAGYLTPGALPGLRPYLRAKYGLSDELANRVEGYVEAVQENRSQLRREEGRHDNARDQAP